MNIKEMSQNIIKVTSSKKFVDLLKERGRNNKKLELWARSVPGEEPDTSYNEVSARIDNRTRVIYRRKETINGPVEVMYKIRKALKNS